MERDDDSTWYEPDQARLQAALRLLGAVCAHGATVADLGCLYGAYAVAFARAGYRSVGIDARPENIEHSRGNAVAAELSDRQAAFICADVRNIENFGPFDAVWCSGLLYHMEKPLEILNAIGKVTTELLIVQTHISLEGDRPIRYKLSGETPQASGHWYKEGDPNHPWSAFGNDRSWWLTRTALLDGIQDAGFGLVMEIHDHLADIQGDVGRIMVAGIKA